MWYRVYGAVGCRLVWIPRDKKRHHSTHRLLTGSRRYKSLCDQFSQGQTLDIYAEQLMEDSGMAVFTARVEDQGELVAQCQLNVYVPTEQKLQEMKTRSPS